MLKQLSLSLFFIFIAFIQTNSAQNSTDDNLQINAEKPQAISFRKAFHHTGDGKNPFAESFFVKDEKGARENSLENLPEVKLAQEATEPVNYKLKRGAKEWNFEFAYSPFEPTHFSGEKEYNTAGRKLGLAVFRWGRVIGTTKGVTFQYLFESIPFLFSLKNEVRNPDFVSPTETPDEAPTKREAAYGFGITPAAFRFYFLPKSRLKPFAHVGTGFIITSKSMPVPDSSWFNFTGYFGGGVMYQLKPDRAVTFSYRYFHISNAQTAVYNPGYNANVFALGYSFFY